MINSKPEKFIKAAAGVIFKEEDDRRFILLIQRAKDDHWLLHYEFPRGKCDKPIGEDVIKCLNGDYKIIDIIREHYNNIKKYEMHESHSPQPFLKMKNQKNN